MSETRYLPRKIPFDELIRVLASEHGVIREQLRLAKEASERKDFEALSTALKRMEVVFRQHIVDEEAQIIRQLVGELGVKGAEEEIKVFQQHRPIYRLMQAVAELASKKASEFGSEQAALSVLFEQHAAAEEERVYPKALRCYEDKVQS